MRVAAAPILAALCVVASSCVGATDVAVEPAEPTEATGAAGADTTDLAESGVPRVAVPACVGELSVEQKVSQVLMPLVSRPLDAAELVTQGIVGGYGLVGTQSADVGAQIEAVNAVGSLPLIVASDEEGGLVQRLRDVLGPVPSARDTATNQSVAEATAAAQRYGSQMAQLGFTMNFGPVLDVGKGSGLGDRSYGDDVDTVTNFGLGVLQGFLEAGIVAVAKHWPGIGGGGADPHNASTSVASLDALKARDLLPFERAFALGAPAVMVSHAIIPDTSEGVPASLSRNAITNVLRIDEGFNGLVITDSLGMRAVTKHAAESSAALLSIVAGADIALLSGPGVARDAYNAVLGAVNSGLLPVDQLDQSVARVLTVKGITGSCPVV